MPHKQLSVGGYLDVTATRVYRLFISLLDIKRLFVQKPTRASRNIRHNLGPNLCG